MCVCVCGKIMGLYRDWETGIGDKDIRNLESGNWKLGVGNQRIKDRELGIGNWGQVY